PIAPITREIVLLMAHPNPARWPRHLGVMPGVILERGVMPATTGHQRAAAGRTRTHAGQPPPAGPERWPGFPATGLGQKHRPAGSAIWPGHPVDGDSWSARGLPRKARTVIPG